MMELFIIFAAIVGIVYFSHQHRERMTLIKKGEHAGKINFRNNRGEALRFGLFLIGVALGFIAGAILSKFHVMNSDIGYVAMILLFGGAALLLSYAISNKKDNDDIEKVE